MNIYTTLKELIDNKETLIVPDAYDGISAKIIEAAGFKAVQCSGYSFSISKKYTQESYISFDENISITKTIVDAVSVPVFADGEDGYGSGEVFLKNIKRFYKTGIAGINIEDQNLWSGFTGEALIPASESVSRIRAVKDNFPELIVNARTDALAKSHDKNEGIKEAIKRSNAFYEAGGDLCFVTGVSTKEEIQLLQKEIAGPVSIAAGLPYNIDNFDISDCVEIGIARVSLPSVMIFNAVKSQLNMLKVIGESGSLKGIKDELCDIKTLLSLLK